MNGAPRCRSVRGGGGMARWSTGADESFPSDDRAWTRAAHTVQMARHSARGREQGAGRGQQRRGGGVTYSPAHIGTQGQARAVRLCAHRALCS
eukprot:6892412-Prymnesium_polylepis.1